MIFLIGLVSATNYPTNEQINLSISCENINCSDGDVYITIIDQNGQQIIDNQNTTKSNGYLFYQTTIASDGDHSIFLASDNDYYSTTFVATESGIEMSEGRSVLTIGLIGLLVFLLFVCLFALFNMENYIGKFALYWISHVLLVLICFAGWQVGVEGLLQGTALTGIFKILFWTFIVGIVPMLILSLAWIFYIHAFNEHFQKLVDKGVDPEEAFKMTKRKKGGWFNGQ